MHHRVEARSRRILAIALIALSAAGVYALRAALGLPASASSPGTRSAHVSLATTGFDVASAVGRVRLGAKQSVVARRLGIPNRLNRVGRSAEFLYSGLIVRVYARRVVGFEVEGARFRDRRGVSVGSSLRRWRKAYPRLRRAGDGLYTLSSARGNLSALHVRSGRVTAISMVWRGGRVRSGAGAGHVGRGAGGANPFAGNGRDGKVPCSRDGKSGWCWCTWWAYEKRADVYNNSAGKRGVPRDGWDAKMWLPYAAKGGGYPTGTEPVVGALAVFPNSSKWGHIAFVESVNDDGSFVISEYNRRMDGKGPTTRPIQKWMITSEKIGFIYGGPATGGEYIGHIVHWAGDTKQQKTSWLVVNKRGKPRRNWIPSSATFNCLKTAGHPGPDSLPGDYLSLWLPDVLGEHAGCAGGGGGPARPAPVDDALPTPTPAPAPAPPAPTPAPAGPPPSWSEQQGSLGANTFTNPYNASGLGPRIAASQWVQVSCKVYAPQIASANPDGYWYRIASGPWNNQYYAVANTFWNGDIPGQKPYTHNTDWAVANC